MALCLYELFFGSVNMPGISKFRRSKALLIIVEYLSLSLNDYFVIDFYDVSGFEFVSLVDFGTFTN